MYRPLAVRGSALFFLMQDLQGLNHMYRFSLSVFLSLVKQVTAQAQILMRACGPPVGHRLVPHMAGSSSVLAMTNWRRFRSMLPLCKQFTSMLHWELGSSSTTFVATLRCLSSAHPSTLWDLLQATGANLERHSIGLQGSAESCHALLRSPQSWNVRSKELCTDARWPSCKPQGIAGSCIVLRGTPP